MKATNLSPYICKKLECHSLRRIIGFDIPILAVCYANYIVSSIYTYILHRHQQASRLSRVRLSIWQSAQKVPKYNGQGYFGNWGRLTLNGALIYAGVLHGRFARPLSTRRVRGSSDKMSRSPSLVYDYDSAPHIYPCVEAKTVGVCAHENHRTVGKMCVQGTEQK